MKEKRRVEDMSGFCREPGTDGHGHRHCSWGQGIETPSAIVTCVCQCHAPRKVLVPKK